MVKYQRNRYRSWISNRFTQSKINLWFIVIGGLIDLKLIGWLIELLFRKSTWCNRTKNMGTTFSSCPWSWSHWFVARWLSGWTSRHRQSGREVGLTFSPNGSSSIWYYCGWVSERVTAQICQMSRLPIGPPTNLCWTFHHLLPVRPQQTVHHVAVPNHHSSRWPYRGCWRCRTDRIPGKHKTWCLLGYWHARETQDLRWLLTQRHFRFRKWLNSSSSLLVGVVLNWRFRVNRILLMMDQIRGQAAHVAWTKQPRPYFFIIQDRDQSLKSDWGSFFEKSVTLESWTVVLTFVKMNLGPTVVFLVHSSPKIMFSRTSRVMYKWFWSVV